MVTFEPVQWLSVLSRPNLPKLYRGPAVQKIEPFDRDSDNLALYACLDVDKVVHLCPG